MNARNMIWPALCAVALTGLAGTRHAGDPVFTGLEGRILAEYRGAMRVPVEGLAFARESLVDIDQWPDMTEYVKTHETGLKLANGETARTVTSADAETADTHFRWMREYGVDGVFLHRSLHDAASSDRAWSAKVLKAALSGAAKNGRAVAVVWDLTGFDPAKDDCRALIADWKYLVDAVRVTSFGEKNLYLHHRGKPLVAVSGVGAKDALADVSAGHLAEFLDFLRGDPEYGGCSVMLGVPYGWRGLGDGCEGDAALHALIREADAVFPRTVGCFSAANPSEMDRYAALVAGDIAWCAKAGVDYLPLVHPGYSHRNASRQTRDRFAAEPLAGVPRAAGRFYWNQIQRAVAAGAKGLYVASFDGADEGTAIFKTADMPPVGRDLALIGMDGQPSDHYLFLTAEAKRLLAGERAPTQEGELPVRTFVYTGNPFATHQFYADPSARVWNGRLYVYPSHDIDPPRGCDFMDRYHVLSTDDLVHWTDHGEILRTTDLPWGRPEGGFMWAPDCAFRDGKYYFYYPHPCESKWTHSWRIGVAVSDRPDGGFKDAGWVPGLGGFGLIDPCVFTDTDGQSYMYVGGAGKLYQAKMKANMVELEGDAEEITNVDDFHEGPWVFRRGEWYYLIYPDNRDYQNRQRYMMSKAPLGPWENKGVFFEPTGCDTSHGSIVEFKGEWYFFYHNCVVSGRGGLRTLCFDKVEFNDDGTMRIVGQTRREREQFWKGE